MLGYDARLACTAADACNGVNFTVKCSPVQYRHSHTPGHCCLLSCRASPAGHPPSTSSQPPPGSSSSGPGSLTGAAGLGGQQAGAGAAAPKGMGLAQKLLEKMGWREGQGLGRNRQGMATPLVAQKTAAHAGAWCGCGLGADGCLGVGGIHGRVVWRRRPSGVVVHSAYHTQPCSAQCTCPPIWLLSCPQLLGLIRS